MKKAFLALAAVVVTLSAVAPAHADNHQHHRFCHKVKADGHWQNRCH
jgi:Spy/CpxP family protein refolding chaperone